MINQELTAIFEDLGDMEEIEGNRWESLAYRKVATSISLLSEDIVELEKKGTLRKIEGVGSAIEKKIIEYIQTGKISKHVELKKKYDIDFTSLRNIRGLGPKRIIALYAALKVRNLDDLIRAIEANEVSKVPGFGQRSQDSLKKAVELYLSTGASRIPIAQCYDEVIGFVSKLKSSGYFGDVQLAGSARRLKDNIGDIDILVTSSQPPAAAEFFAGLPEVRHVIAKGDTKISVLLSLGLNCDMRIIDRTSWGSALQYFTGSKEHNIRLRGIAISKGMKLSEYGLFKDEAMVAGSTEEQVYSHLGLPWIPPELRENLGEIDSALNGNLPSIVAFDQIHGDLHTHTNETDGHSSLSDMVEKAKELGLRYIAVTEHSASLKIANGMDEERFRKRNDEIERMNENDNSITVLKGVELEILRDGNLDLSPDLLKEMDFVVGAMHQGVSDSMDTNTSRLIKAIESGQIHTLAHPTGRLFGTREPYHIDFERIFEACNDNNVALEINGFPTRSDLPYDLVKQAKEHKVKFSLGSDAHSTEQLKYLRFATAIARRGWLEVSDIVNGSFEKKKK